METISAHLNWILTGFMFSDWFRWYARAFTTSHSTRNLVYLSITQNVHVVILSNVFFKSLSPRIFSWVFEWMYVVSIIIDGESEWIFQRTTMGNLTRDVETFSVLQSPFLSRNRVFNFYQVLGIGNFETKCYSSQKPSHWAPDGCLLWYN